MLTEKGEAVAEPVASGWGDNNAKRCTIWREWAEHWFWGWSQTRNIKPARGGLSRPPPPVVGNE